MDSRYTSLVSYEESTLIHDETLPPKSQIAGHNTYHYACEGPDGIQSWTKKTSSR